MISLALLLALAAFEPEPLLPGTPYALKGHTDGVVALAFSPDGTQLASASRDKTVRLWSLTTGAVTRTISGAQEQLSSLSYSADGKRLAVGDVGLHVRVLDPATGAVVLELAHPDGVAEVSLDADGAVLAVAGLTDGGAVYEVPSGKKRFEFRGKAAQFTADGKSLVIASGAGSFSFVDPRTGKARKTVKTAPEVVRLAMTPSGSTLATWVSGGLDVRLWDETGTAGPVLKGPTTDADRRQARITGLALTPDGKQVAVGGADGVVRLWSVEKKAVTTVWPVDKSLVVTISRDGAWLAVTDSTLIKLWKLK